MKKAIILLSAILTIPTALAEANSKLDGVYTRYINGKTDSNSSEITLKNIKHNVFKVTGTSIWVGNAETGNVNTGEFAGTSIAKDNILDISSDGCKLTITVSEDSLTVTKDNFGCGGLNVSFDGFYKK